METYVARLHRQIQDKNTPALVGLDPRFELLPPAIVKAAQGRGGTDADVVASAFEEFCRRIVDVVAPLVPAVKPQAAFFEEWGPPGCAALQRVIHHARRAGLVVICDAKRGDIGSTAEAYARGYLAGEDASAAPWGADALTVNPYLGRDTLEPFIKVAHERGGGVYVLVRTSNPGAGSFQDRVTDGVPHYRYVAGVVEELSAGLRGDDDYGCVGAVVGATYPAELVELRSVMPHVPLLVPGYGSQGGTAADVAAAFDQRGHGGLVNNSRGINFAFRQETYRERFAPEEWEQATAAATQQMIADLQNALPG